MRSLLRFTLLAALAACCSCTGGPGGTTSGNTNGGNGSNGGGTSGGGSAFSIVTLDATPDAGSVANDLAIAVGPNDTVGVAYLQDAKVQNDAGVEQYNVQYVSWSAGAVSTPAVIDQVQNLYGVSVAFDSSGNPNVAYLGGQPYGGPGANASNYWVQGQAVVATQKGGTWTNTVVDDGTSDPNGPTFMGTAATCTSPCAVANGQCSCTSPYNATGPSVVGLYSSLGFDSKGVLYDYFRDVGFGECDVSEVGNCGASRIEGEFGALGGTTLEWAFLGDTWDLVGTPVHGLGAHLHLVMANDQPALITDEFGGTPGAESGGSNADFIMRLGPNNWSVPVQVLNLGDSQTGPDLAWNKTYGFAAVGYDQSPSVNTLWFTQSTDGVTWTRKEDVFAGAGGWFPSIAIDPVRSEPAITDLFCYDQPVEPTLESCPVGQRNLEVRELAGSGWGNPTVVDPAGGYLPKIAFLSTGKRVIAYFQLVGKGQVGPLMLAVEQ